MTSASDMGKPVFAWVRIGIGAEKRGDQVRPHAAKRRRDLQHFFLSGMERRIRAQNVWSRRLAFRYS